MARLAPEQGLTRGVKIWPTLSAESAGRRESSARLPSFPLPWSHYVRLVGLAKEARRFYEAQALRGGWTERQLKRQVETEFYERTVQSRGAPRAASQSGDELSAEEEIRDPYILEFLGLKDQYSESDIEDALIRQVESFLLELGAALGKGARCAENREAVGRAPHFRRVAYRRSAARRVHRRPACSLCRTCQNVDLDILTFGAKLETSA